MISVSLQVQLSLVLWQEHQYECCPAVRIWTNIMITIWVIFMGYLIKESSCRAVSSLFTMQHKCVITGHDSYKHLGVGGAKYLQCRIQSMGVLWNPPPCLAHLFLCDVAFISLGYWPKAFLARPHAESSGLKMSGKWSEFRSVSCGI